MALEVVGLPPDGVEDQITVHGPVPVRAAESVTELPLQIMLVDVEPLVIVAVGSE